MRVRAPDARCLRRDGIGVNAGGCVHGMGEAADRLQSIVDDDVERRPGIVRTSDS